MKNILLIGVLWFLSTWALAQVYVDGENINEKDIQYCMLYVRNPTPLSKTDAWIDHGQRFVRSEWRRMQIAGSDRKPILFNSAMDALNFMMRNGWEMASSKITFNKEGSEDLFIYLLRKKGSLALPTDDQP